mmetsp:Transcript_9165/g.13715  ORF Transcript_9165/g.13715 Transcript_9165/m.13715 type:complete len:219 (+) Transcript_9165:1941-2597(+)
MALYVALVKLLLSWETSGGGCCCICFCNLAAATAAAVLLATLILPLPLLLSTLLLIFKSSNNRATFTCCIELLLDNACIFRTTLGKSETEAIRSTTAVLSTNPANSTSMLLSPPNLLPIYASTAPGEISLDLNNSNSTVRCTKRCEAVSVGAKVIQVFKLVLRELIWTYTTSNTATRASRRRGMILILLVAVLLPFSSLSLLLLLTTREDSYRRLNTD